MTTFCGKSYSFDFGVSLYVCLYYFSSVSVGDGSPFGKKLLTRLKWGRWSCGKTQDSGLRGPGFETRPDRRIFFSKIFVPRCSSSPRCINR